MARFKAVARHSSYLLASKLLSRLLFTLFSVYAAVRLGPDLFGALAFTLAAVELANTFGDMGITRYGTRELVRNPGARGVIAGEILTLQLATSFLFSATGLILVASFHPAAPKSQLLLIGLAAVMVSGAVSATEAVLIANESFFMSATGSLLGRVVFTGAGFLALLAGLSVTYVMWGFLVGLLAELTLRLVWVLRNILRFSFSFSLRQLRAMLGGSVPFALGATASIVLLQVGVVLLGLLDDDAAVGVYSVAFALYMPFMWAPVILAKTIFPGLTEMFNRDETAAKMNSWQWFRLMAMTGIPLAALVTILAEPVLAYMPAGYGDSSGVLIILIWSLPPTLLASIEINIMQIMNRERQSAVILGVTAVIAVALSLALIPPLGPRGAALALLIGALLREIQMYAYIYRHFMGKHVALHFIRPAAGGLAMLGVALLLGGFNIWLAAAAATAAYTAVIFFTGGLRPGEIRALLGSR